MKNRYLLTVYDESKNDAGSKAKQDVEKFLLEDGYASLQLKLASGNDIVSKLRKLKIGNIDIPRILRKDIDVLVLQYPFYSMYLMKKLIVAIEKKKKINLIFIIHDIEALRLFKDDQNYIAEEVALLNKANGLVVHNRKMANWLKIHGVNTKMVDLEIFDYDNPQKIKNNNKYDNTICFAGNLKKSIFLNKIKSKELIEVFGPNPQSKYPKNIVYKGVYPPDELPKYLTQSFGLVWDGNGTFGCDGIYGEYMKYNNPHKVSLYLSTGIPVIIWEKAALADFVRDNNLGITIGDLNNIDQVLSGITADKYAEMKKNVLRIGTEMRKGRYIKTAMREILG